MVTKAVRGVWPTGALLAGIAVGSVGALAGCGRDEDASANTTPGAAVRADGLAQPQAELAKRVTSAPAKAMAGSGLAGVAGGVRVRVTTGDPQEVQLPIPQLAGGQVPVCYLISGTPADAVAAYRFRKAEGGDIFVGVRLTGKGQDVRIAWSAAVLLTPHEVTPDRTPAEPYRAATPCAQATANEVTKAAGDTWPASGKVEEFAAAIQRFVRDRKRVGRPASLDAVGILRSGENGICTANANLACALMRAKGVACRSVAVVPTIAQRLEMHRIAEYHAGGRWVPFDPSWLTADVPARPWQHVVMARTAVRDEEVAMKPRMGAMVGCPYGQEAELLTPGVTLSGEDFFWTQAAPLSEFEVGEELSRKAAAAWGRYLETGALTPGQVKARSAATAAELAECLKDG